ncbi:MAG: hypothetical protein OXK78_12345 [Caldilineaceae bacterium]|nr:hypothetical protein [Caldilineaceae bacterium]
MSATKPTALGAGELAGAWPRWLAAVSLILRRSGLRVLSPVNRLVLQLALVSR